jgi:antitoxin HicB
MSHPGAGFPCPPRRLNWKRELVDRLFRLNHATRLEQFDAAFRALGHRVEISVHQ